MKKSSLFAMLAALALSVSAPVLANDGEAQKSDAPAKEEGKTNTHHKAKGKGKAKGKSQAKKATDSGENKAGEGGK